MHVKNPKYLAVETTSSTIVNGLLNLLGAFLEFHGRTQIPTTGHGGLVQDTIGQTFIVAFLSVLVPSLLTRRRQRAAGYFEQQSEPGARKPANLYLHALTVGVVFTALGAAFNAMLLPRLFPDTVSHAHVLLYKTVYGAVVGMFATWFALRAILTEAN